MLHPVLVTGASRGIGRALSIATVGAGHPVYALARPGPRLDDVGTVLKGIQPRSRVIACDLSNPRDIARAASQVATGTPRLHAIVHNASIIGPIRPMHSTTRDDFERVVAVGVTAVDDLTRRLLPLLDGGGRVGVISSGAALRPIPSWSAYCVAKAGVEMWVRCAAVDLAPRGITVIAAGPGVVDTQMQAEIRAANPEEFPWHARFVTYHREGQLRTPREVAERLLPALLWHPADRSGQRVDINQPDLATWLERCRPG